MALPLRAVAVIALTSVALAGQVPVERPAFEVTSVKINKTAADATSLGFNLQSGRFRAVNEPLWRLVAEAYRTTYQLRRFEIVGIPRAMDGLRFDVEAVPPAGATSSDRPLMLRQLLADRFKLTAHPETRELPVYNLVTQRADGRLGPHLKHSEIDCVALRAGRSVPPAATDGIRPCVMVFGQGLLRANGMRIADLAEMGLSRSVSAPVIDRTGLAGAYEWTLEWLPDSSSSSGANDPDRVPLVTALQEQLGLKLETGRGPVQVVVIDHAESPIPD
jgi:uncharacterized protein (TIGR03435 family)